MTAIYPSCAGSPAPMFRPQGDNMPLQRRLCAWNNWGTSVFVNLDGASHAQGGNQSAVDFGRGNSRIRMSLNCGRCGNCLSLLATDALSVTTDAVDCFCLRFNISAFTGLEDVIAGLPRQGNLVPDRCNRPYNRFLARPFALGLQPFPRPQKKLVGIGYKPFQRVFPHKQSRKTV